jgi:hypothetical protein
MFKVECFYLGGWADAGWTVTGATDIPSPMRFDTLAAAEQAIDEFIADTVEAYQAGNLDSPYDRAEFRAVPVA